MKWRRQGGVTRDACCCAIGIPVVLHTLIAGTCPEVIRSQERRLRPHWPGSVRKSLASRSTSRSESWHQPANQLHQLALAHARYAEWLPSLLS
jgi:hypothetical protein